MSTCGQENIVYIKLGGSLITDKRAVETPRLPVIKRLAHEIAAARRADPGLRLLIGHGSGSFGPVVGSRYGTRQGVSTSEEWYGFAATADAAARLNRIVAAALLAEGVPAWSIQPSVDLRCQNGRIVAGPLAAVQEALAHNLVPLIYGDVALDSVRGGTIAGTEEIFDWLADHLPPHRMILAGEVDGVYTSDPQREPGAQLIPVITPETLSASVQGLGASIGTDVTGGMLAKVQQAVQMVDRHSGLRVLICSGLAEDSVYRALTNELFTGTVICQTTE
jgi:isopentenyl phosphate kinase